VSYIPLTGRSETEEYATGSRPGKAPDTISMSTNLGR